MNLSPLPIQKFFDNAGRPLNGGLLFTYVATTTTKIATYTDSTGGTPNTNPIVLNYRGEANVWLDPTLTYKFVLAPSTDTDPPTNPIWSVDNIASSITLAFLTQQIIGQILYPRTAAEISAGVTPVSYAYPENDVDRYTDADAPVIYLKFVSALKNGEPFDALRAIPKSKWSAMRDYTSTYDAQPQLALLMGDLTTARRSHIYMSDGLWNLGAALTNIPIKIRITGSDRRSFGSSSGTYAGTIILATQNTASPIQIIQGGLTATDIMIEHLGIYGTGTGANIDGLTLNNIAGITLRDMVVSNFTRRNISFSGGNYMVCQNVYSSLAGESCYYINGDHCTLQECSSDGGQYSVNATSAGSQFEICGRSHFEGPSTRCLNILGSAFKMIGGILRPTTASTGGAYFNAALPALIGTEIFGASGTSFGVESDTGVTEYRYQGITIRSFSTAMILREGIGSLTGSELSGNTTGLELVGGSYVGNIDGNHIAGVTNSILHTSGNAKWLIGTNRLCDASAPQTFKAMTVTAGFPVISGAYEGAPPSVASVAALSLPYGARNFSITGVTNITSINASGWSDKEVTLIFTGILTFTNGSNLKLTGNFVTAAGSAITLSCDGTNWFEVGRKA